MLRKSNQIWEQEIPVDPNKIKELAEEINRSPLFVEVCWQRGLTTAAEIEKFLAIDESWFHDPFLMKDMAKAIERIVQAIENEEQITIYGDYDADGMTATALLYESLMTIGANVDYYLPNRFVEGYGPNVEAFAQIIADGTGLIITVDNGVTGHEAIEFAQSKEVDVIITDHHALPEILPAAYAIVHPAHPEGNYPFADLAGVGVALKVASALLGELPLELLDLATIGTVADLVSLQGENRAIVYYGLQMIANTQRLGLQELLQVIGSEPEAVDEDIIGFQIAPRLNALGRLGEAKPGVALLTTHDSIEAKELAQLTDEKNIERKNIVDQMTEEAFAQLQAKESEPDVIVLSSANWHQGVLGIVASRLVEKTNKINLLFTIDEESQIATGSARSIKGVDLFAAFTEIADLFITFGGHEMAAGMTAHVDQLELIEEKLAEYLRMHAPTETIQKVDAFARLEDLSVEVIKELQALKPYGTGNTKPLIASSEVAIVQNRTVGLNGDHLKLQVEQNGTKLDIISFRNGNINEYLFDQQTVSVAGYVELNEWNGQTNVQMQMTNLQISGPQLIDERMTKLSPTDFKQENTQYIFYDSKNYEQYKQFLASSSEAILIESLPEAQVFKGKNQMIIVDCPKSIAQFKLTIADNTNLPIHCYFYKEKHLYLTGLPTRLEFTQVYKFLLQQQAIDLKKDGHHLINYLKIDSNKIFLIVQVFLEAKFVIIENGLLKRIDNPEKMALEQTKSYQDAVKQFKAEELFVYSSFKEIMDALNE